MKIQTDATFYNTDDGINYQRSSALKSLESCSWLYYCNYVLDLPQGTNDGALKGNVCHTFLESLLNPRHKKHYNLITKKGSIKGSKACEELVWKLMKVHHLPLTEEVFNHIDGMLLVALKNNFYCKGSKIVGKEYRFKINNESPKYSIYGTMDKLSINGKKLIIEDYKSSKKKYEGEEIHANVQALMYSLAAKKIWPDLQPVVRFIFLQFPDNPFIEIEYNENTLKGFEYYLEMIQTQVDNFTLEAAKNGFAADKKRGENTFTGSLLCGYSKFPGHKNKEGKAYWHCPYKFPYDYYVLIKDGHTLQSSLTLAEIESLEGAEIKKLRYDGCPRYQQPVADMMPKIQVPMKGNVLDDF